MEYEDQEDEQETEVQITTKMPSPVETTPLRKPRYKECLKNHAVGIGGHATDGCGEFIPAGMDGTLESLKCAACNCHRNFHRKENETASFGFHSGGGHHLHQQHQHQHQQQQQLLLTHHPHGHHHHHFAAYRSPSGYLHVAASQQQQQRGVVAPQLALPSSSGGEEMMEDYYNNNNSGNNPSGSSGKKRFRTRFSQEQKDKMLDLAERLGWKIQKQDEEMVLHFCNELGIKRHVLKVWMHNNKHTLGKKITTSEGN